MRVLVTGGAGFIGSHIVDALVAGGHDVVALDDLSSGYRDNVNPAAEFVQGDVADDEVARKAVAGCDTVLHLAAHRGVLPSVENPRQTDRVNTGGTLAVLTACRDSGVRRVVCTSSSSVYGGVAPMPTPESAPVRPRSPYAVSKVAGENYARVFWELFGLEAVTIRPFNVYGPRQRPDSQYAAVIPLFIAALRSGRAPVVHGDGLQSRDFSYIDDVVGAYLAAASAPAEVCAGRVYNVAGGSARSLLDLLAALGRILGVEPSPRHIEPRAGDVRDSRADLSAAGADLGWAPRVDFEEGLRRTVAWAAEAHDSGP